MSQRLWSGGNGKIRDGNFLITFKRHEPANLI